MNETHFFLHMIRAHLFHVSIYAPLKYIHLPTVPVSYSSDRGFRWTKGSCFCRTLIYHTVIPLISAASNISILKK